MAGYRDIRTGRHCVFILHVHLVFVPRYRHKVFGSAHLERMEEIMRDVCADFRAELAGFNGEPEHVHLLVNFPPTVAISRLFNSLKGVSSGWLRQEFPDLRQHYWRARRLWSGSYFAGSAREALISVLRSTSNSKTRRPDGLISARLHHRPEGQRTAAILVAGHGPEGGGLCGRLDVRACRQSSQARRS